MRENRLRPEKVSVWIKNVSKKKKKKSPVHTEKIVKDYMLINPLDPTDFHPVCGISPWFPKMSTKCTQNLGKVSKYKRLPRHIYLWKLNYFSCIRSTFSWASKWYIGLLWAVNILCRVLFWKKCGSFWKNGRFSGRIWPDWGNTTRADMAGLGSIGLKGCGGVWQLSVHWGMIWHLLWVWV